MKLMLVPSQTSVPGIAAMLTLTGKLAFIVIVSVFDVAGDPVIQRAFEVNIHVMKSASAKVDDV